MKVLLGITGSIAAYKALELIRLLRKQDFEVRVVLTSSALNFITPLSCQTLSANEVYLDQFALTSGIKHLTLVDWSDILVVAPATANIIGKAAGGIADDLLSTTMISYQKPILLVPAMDQGMWDNRIVQGNVALLQDAGWHLLQPAVGALASGKIGRGRFPAVTTIVKKITTILEKKVDLKGMRFLVTGGRTEEDIDPVRVVTNRSTGMMGAELLQAVLCRGGEVKGIFGEVACSLPEEVETIRVRTSVEMMKALENEFGSCDCLIMTAAVGDYRPKKKNAVKAHGSTYPVTLVKNEDLLKELAKRRRDQIVVGFSLEDRNEWARARGKMKAKELNFIVLNSTAAIGNDRIEASILRHKGKPVLFKEQTKWQFANCILDECLVQFKSRLKK
jgi:phosphopantothenoylcysteine decarboxylase/phosphopantothenate--cysteine ligase